MQLLVEARRRLSCRHFVGKVVQWCTVITENFSNTTTAKTDRPCVRVTSNNTRIRTIDKWPVFVCVRRIALGMHLPVKSSQGVYCRPCVDEEGVNSSLATSSAQ
jgi:hypothetical protein